MSGDLMKRVIDFLVEKDWWRKHHHMASISSWHFSKSGNSVVVLFSDGRKEVVSISEVLKSEVA